MGKGRKRRAPEPVPPLPWYASVSWVWLALMAAWTGFIWWHSFQTGDLSLATSRHWVEILRPVLEFFGVEGEDLMGYVVRKLAHFCEFGVLGLLSGLAFRPVLANDVNRESQRGQVWHIVVPLILLGIACIDEFIQFHIEGRDANTTDVLIDCSGALLGLLVVLVVLYLIRRWRAR